MATLVLPGITIAGSVSLIANAVIGLSAVTADIPAGTVLYNVTVYPPGWIGQVALSGTPGGMVAPAGTAVASPFTINVGPNTLLASGVFGGGVITVTP